jgi:hypothetical protein
MLAIDYGDNGMSGGTILLWTVLGIIIFGLPYFGIFRKAGKPGWLGFIPIANIIVLLQVIGRPVWWILLFLIPIVNIVILVLVDYDLSKSFGHGGWFTVGLIFLSWIFLMILAFGSSTYRGPAAGQPVTATPPPPVPTPPSA